MVAGAHIPPWVGWGCRPEVLLLVCPEPQAAGMFPCHTRHLHLPEGLLPPQPQQGAGAPAFPASTLRPPVSLTFASV